MRKSILITGAKHALWALLNPYKFLFKNIAESEALHKTLAESSPDCIKLFDKNGGLIYINETGLKEYRFKDLEEAQKSDFSESIIMGGRKKFRDAFEKALGGETSTITIQHTPEGSTRETSLETMSPVKNGKGKVEFIYGVSRDISKLQKIDKVKTEFVAVASHQLRTPLTSISLASELLLSELKNGGDTKKLKSYAGNIYRDVRSMSALIDRLLNISRMEAGTFVVRLQPVVLTEFFNEALDKIAPLIKRKGLKLKKIYGKNLPSVLKIDKTIMMSVFENLITNSIKYTPRGGTITISLEAGNPDIFLRISDTGPGIPEAVKPKVFTKLFRPYDVLKKGEEKGSGIGLYIAREMIQATGGKIELVKSDSKGTVFLVSIPRKEKRGYIQK